MGPQPQRPDCEGQTGSGIGNSLQGTGGRSVSSRHRHRHQPAGVEGSFGTPCGQRQHADELDTPQCSRNPGPELGNGDEK